MLKNLFKLQPTTNSRRKLCSFMSAKVVKLEIKQGIILGQQQCLPNGNVFHMFQGIPYAVPPLGELRFKSPIPLERFEERELDCTTERAVSFQRDPWQMEIVGSENCLFLNVYAPQNKPHTPLPVMVWIHGGGFSFGNGNAEYHFPQALLEENVVVVTITYRLGALGFLCLPEAGIWGNAGLKDQRLALQWVQENIAKFNGDPSNVTIFGESAGAAAVHLHAYANHANKLFHKAIMQSGTANMEWVFQANPSVKARRLAQLLGCNAHNDNDILEFLQSNKVSEEAILSNTLAVLTPDERRRELPLTFKPVVEDSHSPDSFVSMPILDALQQRNRLGTMPMVMGYNSAESIAMVFNAVRKLSVIEQDLERYVPRNLPFSPTDIEVKELAAQIRHFYFNGHALSSKNLDNLVDMLSDYHFTVDMQHAAELQMRHQHEAPLYFYRFDYIGARNMYKRFFQLEKLRGACHGDELFYLFQMYYDRTKLADDDALMVKRICRLWANFARYGQPTPHGIELPIIDCAWLPVERPAADEEQFSLNFYKIDRQCQLSMNPENERVQFWRNIYSRLSRSDYSKLSCKL